MSAHLSLVLIVTALFLGFAPEKALACKCMMPSTEQARDAAEAVFEGRVTNVEVVASDVQGGIGRKRVTLSVVRTWKGLTKEETVTLSTAESSAACGIDFTKDTSYLVYAAQGEGGLEAGSCGRTKPMSDASEDLGVLGAGVTPVTVKDPPKDENKKVAAAPKSGGCGSVSGNASASATVLWLPALGGVLVARRRKR